MDEQAPPVGMQKVARSSKVTARRLSSSVEIIRVRGPDAVHLAEVQTEAIREVLAWAMTKHQQPNEQAHQQDRAA